MAPQADAEAAPGGESMVTFRARIEHAFALSVRVRASLNGPLVVVSHGLVIRAWLGAQVPLGPELALPARIGNTSVTMVAAGAPHAAALVDCAAHLVRRIAEGGSSLSGG